MDSFAVIFWSLMIFVLCCYMCANICYSCNKKYIELHRILEEQEKEAVVVLQPDDICVGIPV